MINKRGFTLIELLVVVVIIGVLALVAVPAVTRYIFKTREDIYRLHEENMKISAENKMIQCLNDNTNGCVPGSGEKKTIYLSQLIEEEFSEKLKDPDKDDNYCSSTESYVIVSNPNNNKAKLVYEVCLKCSDYQSSTCKSVIPGQVCDGSADTSVPVCGLIEGQSTIWTNNNRVISVGCSDEGCGCIQKKYYKRFDENTKLSHIIIMDKAGNTTNCPVSVYVDKENPTCTLEIENGIVNLNFDVNSDFSGIATYGIGTSNKEYDFNKSISYTIDSTTTTVYGYVKDNAGNKGICSIKVN